MKQTVKNTNKVTYFKVKSDKICCETYIFKLRKFTYSQPKIYRKILAFANKHKKTEKYLNENENTLTDSALRLPNTRRSRN